MVNGLEIVPHCTLNGKAFSVFLFSIHFSHFLYLLHFLANTHHACIGIDIDIESSKNIVFSLCLQSTVLVPIQSECYLLVKWMMELWMVALTSTHNT